jgi:magnesium-transporting ATPase (P-type)
LAGRTNCVFLGTSVRSGTATVLVARTGRDTAFGAIAARLRARAPETEFARGVQQFGYLLVRVMLVMVVFVLTVNHLLGRPVIESLLYAVALAVGLSPELLPAIVSVTLSHGARAWWLACSVPSIDVMTFLMLLTVFAANEATFQTAWFVVSLLTELVVVLVLRTQRSAWRSAPVSCWGRCWLSGPWR